MKKLLKRLGKVSIITICMITCLSLCACNASNKKAYEYINSNGNTFSTSSVKTPKGSSVITWKYSSELTKAEKKECANYVKDYYPNAKKLRDATLKYNCHSYAWYSTSTSNKHWMNDPQKYWKDGSYSKYESSKGGIPSKVTKKSKVVYWDGKEVIHSAIVTSSNKFTSKWGPWGLYEHSPKDCPYSQSDKTYKLTFYK